MTTRRAADRREVFGPLSDPAAAVRGVDERQTCGTKGTTMWDTVQTNARHLSHDLPCPRCGHAVHTYLACSDSCDCDPTVMPGSISLAA
ncbi:MAG: hypothetical protein ACRDO4_06605 [Nocardioides sp.]